VAVVDTEVVDTEVVDTEVVDTVTVGTEATAMDIMRKEVERNTARDTTQVKAEEVRRDTKVITNMINQRKDTMTRRAKVDNTMNTGVRSQIIMTVAVILANIIKVKGDRREQNTVKMVATRKGTALRVGTTFTRMTSTQTLMSSMMSTMREETTVSSENTKDIMRIRREVTKIKDISTQHIMRIIMERRAITTRVTMMMITKFTRKNKVTKSTRDMKIIIVKRVAMKKERNGHTVVALGVAVDMEVGMEEVGAEEDTGGTEVENTEMEITEAVDMEMEDTELDMAVDIAETIVVVVVVVTVRKITSLDGLRFHIYVDIFQLLEYYFLVSK